MTGSVKTPGCVFIVYQETPGRVYILEYVIRNAVVPMYEGFPVHNNLSLFGNISDHCPP